MMTTSEYEKTFVEKIHDQGIAEGEFADCQPLPVAWSLSRMADSAAHSSTAGKWFSWSSCRICGSLWRDIIFRIARAADRPHAAINVVPLTETPRQHSPSTRLESGLIRPGQSLGVLNGAI
jgi:hypothetical protein